MRVRFLLGPAGSGKTFRCLEDVRARLKEEPGGSPLIFIAPKQATYQLERQLLADGSVAGYTRLRILSFERLAAFVYERAGLAAPALLDEEGRVMVLRSLLASRKSELKVFRASSRLPGFARQLSGVLREMQQHQLTPARLADVIRKIGSLNRLDDKLHDLTLLLDGYHDWLDRHQLQDGDRWLDLAADVLRGRAQSGQPLEFNLGRDWVEGLWLDGFAQMTPRERSLLMALIGHCQTATLAFCLEHEPTADPVWYSQWVLLSQTFRQCHADLAARPGCEVEVVTLPRQPETSRFHENAVLRHLERHWANPQAYAPQAPNDSSVDRSEDTLSSLRVVKCPNHDAEAVLAAREILRHLRGGGRFRETAVQVRSLESYHACLQRVFTRYEIPFFIDRRESVAHHPLAELTRNALRTIAFGWAHDDWFGALKSGLASLDSQEIDWLENEALAHGWDGRAWLASFGGKNPSDARQRAERMRAELTRPFMRLAHALGSTPTGPVLAHALREFWDVWRVHETLRDWSQGRVEGENSSDSSRNFMRVDSLPSQPVVHPVHETVWDQMQMWLENVSRAFPEEALAVAEWLPILEAGLSGLTVGVVPPVLDQVLVGSIDRSRNPDLKMTVVLGWNETVLPAAPPAPLLLTESDRHRLEDTGHALGSGSKVFLGHERFYAYIACTRARERLVLTHAQRDNNGKILNPSPYLRHVQRLFPNLQEETFADSRELNDACHASEMIPHLLRRHTSPLLPDPGLTRLEEHPSLAPVLDRLRHLQTSSAPVALSPELADRLYGKRLVTSVSRIEDFAACPFRFFTRSGLRVEERLRFELDIRQQGSFQHEVLARFHQSLAGRNLRWRDITAAEARELIGQIAEALIPEFESGMLTANGRNRFLAQNYTAALQQFIEVIIDWMRQYRFDPAAVELGFGMNDDAGSEGLPAWELPLDDSHQLAFIGRIDRIDVLRDPELDRTLCVVIDYKSGQRKVDPLLMEHGIQQQLPAYLNVLRHTAAQDHRFGNASLVPAGVFYVPLRGRFESGANRRMVLDQLAESRRAAFTHQGFADLQVLPHLDGRGGVSRGDQFPYKLTKTGQPFKSDTTLLSEAEFIALLDRQKQWLIEAGTRIFRGDVAVDPWKKGQQSACDQCEFQSVCRIDSWTHVYRVLTPS